MSNGKILYLIDRYEGPHAGTEVQLKKLVLGLQGRGFEPSLVVLRSTPYTEAGKFPCAVECLDISKLARFRTIIRMLKFAFAARSRGFRIAHIFFEDASVIAPTFLKLAGFKVVVGRRDMGLWYTSRVLRLLRFNRHWVDCVVANSRAVKLKVCEEERIQPEKVVVIYNGAPSSRVRPHGQSGIEPEFPGECGSTIGIVANIRRVKRIDEIIRALALVRKRVPGAEVLVAGAGDSGPLKALAAQYHVANAVHFLGAVTDVHEVIARCSVMVLTSESEGLSNAIMEYMSAGKPVVCTDVGGNSELVTHGETGFLYTPGDVSALAEYVHRLLTDPDLARALGSAAIRRIDIQFSLSKMLDQHCELYRTLSFAPCANS